MTSTCSITSLTASRTMPRLLASDAGRAFPSMNLAAWQMRVGAELSEFAVIWLPFVKKWNGKLQNFLFNIPLTHQPERLERFNLFVRNVAIENSREIVGFFFRIEGCPIELVFDNKRHG